MRNRYNKVQTIIKVIINDLILKMQNFSAILKTKPATIIAIPFSAFFRFANAFISGCDSFSIVPYIDKFLKSILITANTILIVP